MKGALEACYSWLISDYRPRGLLSGTSIWELLLGAHTENLQILNRGLPVWRWGSH